MWRWCSRRSEPQAVGPAGREGRPGRGPLGARAPRLMAGAGPVRGARGAAGLERPAAVALLPGVSPLRATQNDQVAILMSTIAPPPSDIALRMAMFSSWGVPVAKGMAGTIMNTLTSYIVR